MTIPKTFDESFAHVSELASRFKENESAYLSQKYMEQEVRDQFLNPFFKALGWDIYHKEHPNPYEREVKIEKSVMVGDRGKRADYAFFTKPNFMQARFLAEAKKPARNLENQYDCFQAIRYGWNSNTPIAVLTDFEQFLVLDSRYKPTVDKSLHLILEKFHYSQFADEETFRRLYYLFSREAVADGSLEKFVVGLKKGKKAKLDAAAPAIGTVQVEPVGDTFLTDLDWHRENLAKAFKRANEGLDGEELTEITQRTLDRLVFIRFLEDKLVEPSEIIDRFGTKTGNAWRDFANEMPRLNSIYNGIIFKPHSILDSAAFEPDEKAFRYTLSWLSHKNSSYDFNSIPIHILGSIYERFLGKTITVTEKRATVEEQPEVRKANDVYYTPEYIVNYIVENTIGKLIAGKSPDEVATMRFADIACGSGSFLLGMFDYLIKYHVEWYSKPKKRRDDAIKNNLVRETADGNLQLTLEHKRDILLNNIYGVDLDAQAVEVAQLSLYLKLLEEETAATVQRKLGGFQEQLLPSPGKNIVHGNSLIDYDIMDGQLFDAKELRKLNPMSFEQTFPEVFARRSGSSGSVQPPATAGGTDIGGFDAIVGNPPYVFGRDWNALQIPDVVKGYLRNSYSASPYQLDMFSLFMERTLQVCATNGFIGLIVPNVWLSNSYSSTTRAFILRSMSDLTIGVPFSSVFKGLTVDTLVYSGQKSLRFGNTIRIASISPESVSDISILNTDTYLDGSRPISTSMNAATADVVLKIDSLTTRLGDIAELTRGIHPYRAGGYGRTAFGTGFQTERDITARPYHSKERIEGYRPFIYGRDLKRFVPPTETEYVYYGEWLAEPRSPKFFEGERIYSRKILGDRLIVTVEKGDSVADQQVYITKAIDSENSASYLAGILGSRLMSFYIRNYFDEVNDAFPQIKVGQLRSLPIRMINFDDVGDVAMRDKVVGLVEKMIDAKKTLADARTDKDREFYERYCENLDRQIDDLVYQLYDITPEERKIIEGN